MKERNLLMVKQESIFTKIKNFILKLFGKNKQELIEAPTMVENNSTEKNSDFMNSIKIEKDADMEKLLLIQKQIEENDNLTEKFIEEVTQDLTKQQKIKLEELYKEQIKELEDKLENYKKKIINVRKKLAVNN